jgi:hypothetical protein
MNKKGSIIGFIENGISVFRNASLGQYKNKSQEIVDWEKNLLNLDNDWRSDKKHLREDRRNVENDIRKTFDNIVLGNG